MYRLRISAYVVFVLFSLEVSLVSSLIFNINKNFLVSSRSSRYSKVNDGDPQTGLLKQLQVRFACDDIDADEISELLMEIGTLSVSVEVETMKDVLNDEAKWSDLQKQKSWDRALLRCNFPLSYDHHEIVSVIKDSFPGVGIDFHVEEVENKDWIAHVQVSLVHRNIKLFTIISHIMQYLNSNLF